MSRRAPQEGRSYEQALYSVVLLVPRLPRPERTGTVRVLLDFIADLWELDRSRPFWGCGRKDPNKALRQWR